MTSNPEFSDSFKKIQEDYIREIPDKIKAMETLLGQLKSAPNAQVVMEFRNHVHKIAGNAATFGFPKATELCKEWDLKLKEIAEGYSPEKLTAVLAQLEPFMTSLKSAFNL